MMLLRCLFAILVLAAPLRATPSWMLEQIEHDLAAYPPEAFCPSCIEAYFASHKHDFQQQIAKITIEEGKVRCEQGRGIPRTRIGCYLLRAMEEGLKGHIDASFPSVTFLYSQLDAYTHEAPVPVFANCQKETIPVVLLPDYEALMHRYQVLPGVDLVHEAFSPPWTERLSRLLWRGGGAYGRGGKITRSNVHLQPRAKICQLSREYPELIDAGVSMLVDPSMERYVKPRLPYEKIFNHRYQLWLDGNATAFTQSGWRLYTGAVVLKEESPFKQWYFGDMEPWVHYVPVKEDLSDLLETLAYLEAHPAQAEQIAENGLAFARSHIAPEPMKAYLLALFSAYKARMEAGAACCSQHQNYSGLCFK